MGEGATTGMILSAATAPAHGTKESYARSEKLSVSFMSHAKMVANVRIYLVGITLVVAYWVIADDYAKRTSTIASLIGARTVESALTL